MANPIKRMDDEHEKIVREAVERLIQFLDKAIPRSKVYTHVNMCLNVLTGGLVTIAHNFVEERDEEKFIHHMIVNLKTNFDVNRKNKRSPSE
jgi:hypothetical protein